MPGGRPVPVRQRAGWDGIEVTFVDPDAEDAGVREEPTSRARTFAPSPGPGETTRQSVRFVLDASAPRRARPSQRSSPSEGRSSRGARRAGVLGDSRPVRRCSPRRSTSTACEAATEDGRAPGGDGSSGARARASGSAELVAAAGGPARTSSTARSTGISVGDPFELYRRRAPVGQDADASFAATIAGMYDAWAAPARHAGRAPLVCGGRTPARRLGPRLLEAPPPRGGRARPGGRREPRRRRAERSIARRYA